MTTVCEKRRERAERNGVSIRGKEGGNGEGRMEKEGDEEKKDGMGVEEEEKIEVRDGVSGGEMKRRVGAWW